jgi:hypothetical protein
MGWLLANKWRPYAELYRSCSKKPKMASVLISGCYWKIYAKNLMRLDKRVAEKDKKIHALANADTTAKRLQGIPGIGPIIANATLCAVGDGKQFKRGRDMVAWLGLTPGQHSSGGKGRLLGICKRGYSHLRTLLIQGAKSALNVIENKTDPRSLRLKTLCCRRHKNIAVVALANKNVRIAWALLCNGLIICRKANRPKPEGNPLKLKPVDIKTVQPRFVKQWLLMVNRSNRRLQNLESLLCLGARRNNEEQTR